MTPPERARPADPPAGLPVALLLPGQGSQHAGMAAGLLGHDPVVTDTVDEVLDLLEEAGGDGDAVRVDWGNDRPSVPVDDARRAQPMLFALDLALVRLVESWGVVPHAVLGHSAGELVAAVAGGVLTLPDAVRMLAERLAQVATVPPGGMLAVAASPDEVAPALRDEPAVALAAVNAARQVMVAGPTAPLARVAAALTAADHVVVTLGATSPFHSPAMDAACVAVEAACAGIALRAPTRAVWSGYTGGRLDAATARDPRFWARQLADPVLFAPALTGLLAEGDLQFVEAGPRQVLTSFARRQRAVRRGTSRVLPLLPTGPGRPIDELRCVHAAREVLLHAAASSSVPPSAGPRAA